MNGNQQWSKELIRRLLLGAGLQHMMDKVSVSERGSNQTGGLGRWWLFRQDPVLIGLGRPWLSAKVRTEVRAPV